MKKIICISFLLTVISAFGQTKTPEDFGFRHIVYKYKTDNVDILIKSKKGEEDRKKPLFFFCQGNYIKSENRDVNILHIFYDPQTKNIESSFINKKNLTESLENEVNERYKIMERFSK